jgi:hypothetical protein
LADQPDLVRLDLLLFHDVDKSIARRVYVKPIRSVFPDARPRLKTAREGNTPSWFYGNDGTKFPKNCLGTLLAKTGEVAST